MNAIGRYNRMAALYQYLNGMLADVRLVEDEEERVEMFEEAVAVAARGLEVEAGRDA